jgi:hypothetical protein
LSSSIDEDFAVEDDAAISSVKEGLAESRIPESKTEEVLDHKPLAPPSRVITITSPKECFDEITKIISSAKNVDDAKDRIQSVKDRCNSEEIFSQALTSFSAGGHDVFNYAISSVDYTKKFSLLLSHVSDENAKSEICKKHLFTAIEHLYPDLLETLLNEIKGEINLEGKRNSDNIFHVIARNNSAEAVKIAKLLFEKIPSEDVTTKIDLRNSNGETPLSLTINATSVEMLKLFVEKNVISLKEGSSFDDVIADLRKRENPKCKEIADFLEEKFVDKAVLHSSANIGNIDAIIEPTLTLDLKTNSSVLESAKPVVEINSTKAAKEEKSKAKVLTTNPKPAPVLTKEIVNNEPVANPPKNLI